MNRKEFIDKFVEEHKNEYESLSKMIWKHPETAYKEAVSSCVQKDFLREQGFAIDENGSVPNAFCARSGYGKPVIAFLGEYDALMGLNQVSGIAEKKELEKGKPGHGCGHNLLGTAALEAAVMLACYLKEQSLEGTVIYMGCPGEESGAGKAFMLREHYFDEVDFAFTWHPFQKTGLMRGTLANVRVLFSFHGKTSHAASAPWDGRSALDACELTNVGVNYLREHVRPEIRMHYAYLNAGGSAPNIVPDEGKLIYAIRAPEDEMLIDLTDRVINVAKGAALMTGTEVDAKVLTYYASVMGVDSMDELVYESIKECMPMQYTEEEINFINSYCENVTSSDDKERKVNIDSEVLGFYESPSSFSTDAGNVSHAIPTGAFVMTSYSKNTNLHTWMATAQGISSVAHKGMHNAARTMVLSAIKLIESKELQEKIKAEFSIRKAQAGETKLLSDEISIDDVKTILP